MNEPLPPYLTDEEIERLTKPLTQSAARCKYLEREYGVKVKRAPGGQPIVGRAEFEAAMTSRKHRALNDRAPAPRPERPNYDVIPGFKRSA